MKKIMLAMVLIALFIFSAVSVAAYNSVDAAVPGELSIGKRAIVQVGAIQYEVTLQGVYNNKAKFIVNGEVTDLLGLGEWTTIADYSEIGVVKISGNTVAFYIDPVPRVSDLNMLTYPLKVTGIADFNFMGRQYHVIVKSLERAGGVFEVNGELVKLRNPKEAESYYDTHFPIDNQAMLYMGMIVNYNGVLYCSVDVGRIQELESPPLPPTTVPEPEQSSGRIIAYNECVREYQEKANQYEYRQNYPEAKQILQEGYRFCGERYGMPIPVELDTSEFDRCVREGYAGMSEDEFVQMTEAEQVRIKERIAERCEVFRPAPPRENPEYEKCREELEAFKQMLVERYDKQGLPIPEELMQKYDEMGARCRILQGWEMPTETVVEVPIPVEVPEEAVERVRYRERVEIPVEKCSGCMWDNSCLPIGTRLVKENGEQTPLFCGVRKTLEHQKQLNERCQNNYECVSNTCQDGMCQSIGARIEGIERELKEQRNILERIASFFGRLFGRG
ncbi:hypothetical protein KY325_02535 [Candidatus Woesearchaeota archaeon]|nr:hypothetical protein [Candidatus Woesearchaeota archaeon]MBW3018011.1 hypothetical protein [Candidatus Woesearchaeota archaeon]